MPEILPPDYGLWTSALNWVWDVDTLEYVREQQAVVNTDVLNVDSDVTDRVGRLLGVITAPTLLAELQLKADLTETQPVSVASLPLPTGAATAALQTQPGVDIGDVTVNNAAGASAVNIQDGGNTITVDASNLDIRDLTFAADKVDASGSSVTASVTGSVTANAGTNLNTSALALDASITTLNTSVNTLLKPANTLAAVTTVGTLSAQATSYGKTLTYVPVAQGAAGTTQLAAANATMRHKIIGCLLTMSAAGTLKFLDGSGDLTGAMSVGASGGFVLPAALLPYQQTATNSALSITSTVGAASGVVTILTEA